MHKLIPPLAGFLLVLFCPPSFAQTQDEQQACENDAFQFCQDAIPDEGRVYACLNKHRRELSHACRQAMVKYSRPGKRRPEREATQPFIPPSRY